MPIAKHTRHKRRRTKHAVATRVKRGGMKLKMASRDDLRAEQLMYRILFSPHMQSSMPLGLQFRYLLEAPPPNCDSVTDARNVLYHSIPDQDDPRFSKEKTLHEILNRYVGVEYRRYCRNLPHPHDCTKTLMLGCKAEMELKDHINEVIQKVGYIKLAQPQSQSQSQSQPQSRVGSLFKRASSLFWSRQPEPEPALQPLWPDPMQLMETFKCDADNFSRKIFNLCTKLYEAKDGIRVYYGVTSELVDLSHNINTLMNKIKNSFEVKLKMLEMTRDIAVPNMIQAYEEDMEDFGRLPEFLFSEDPAEFAKNVAAFKKNLDEAVTQLKYIMGVDSDVVTSQMLRGISHLPSHYPPSSYALSRLAPQSAAIGTLIHNLSDFNINPRALTSLTKNSAFAKLLAKRLTQPNIPHIRNMNAKPLISWHHNKAKAEQDDLVTADG
jgi:hypothetical protein